MENNKTRKFSLEEDFMNLSVDDIVFGYIQHIATYAPELNKLYVPKDKVSAEKKTIAWMIDKTNKTVSNKINKLIELGLIEEQTMRLNGKDTLVYIIPQQTIGKYKVINEEMMWYILSTRKQNTLKIYLYLLNKYDLKLQQKEEMYSFTAAELAEAIGYSGSSARAGSITTVFDALLVSLKREGIIDYEDYYENRYTAHSTPRKRLTFVAHKTSELKNV